MYQGSQGDISASQICSVKTSGADITVLYSAPDVTIQEPALSPDGKKVAFSANFSGNFDIYVVDIDGGEPERLTFDPGVDAAPAWSPDGQWIAFSSRQTGNTEIYVMRANGEDVRAITNDPATDSLPAWAP
jgi:TolB protein